MNAMNHEMPNVIGVKRASTAADEKMRNVLPGYMSMGETGMGNMMMMGHPKNTLPMMSGKGPYGDIEMGGMFTIVKVRAGITSYEDPGWYSPPPGTVARKSHEGHAIRDSSTSSDTFRGIALHVEIHVHQTNVGSRQLVTRSRQVSTKRLDPRLRQRCRDGTVARE